MDTLIHHLSYHLKETVKSYQPVSGDDISHAFFIETSHQRYFMKANNTPDAVQMFKTEALGLETIRKTETVSVPTVIHSGIHDHTAFLVLEYIEAKPASREDFHLLGNHVAKLHQVTSDSYGFSEANFIGSLPQRNSKHDTWVDFYINERLNPQIELALSKQLLSNNEIPDKEGMKNVLNDLFKNVKPSLLHGDLWGGNFIIGIDGIPYLIDPAVYYGHHEVDLAMSKLFGGFGRAFYSAYHDVIPQSTRIEDRIEIYQLYYLLVHLNIFGRSYYGSVQKIFDKYFN
ncbi:MAG: phosphotransferase [Flavobacteriaceae bacterium]|nr:phosphotransferase [Flavobacteriaceae bacterium]